MEVQVIQLLASDKILVTVTQEENGKHEEITRISDVEPKESFKPAVIALQKCVCELCEFPMEGQGKISITKVAFKRTGKEQALGAQIYFNKNLAMSDAPMKSKTPLKFLDKPAEDTPDSSLFSKGQSGFLLKVAGEAAEYYHGVGLEIDAFGKPEE